MGKWKVIFCTVLVAGVGVVFYTPLPGHLDDWWTLQLFHAKFKRTFLFSELRYRFGLSERLPALREGMESLMGQPYTEEDEKALKINDRQIDGVPVRVYQPKSAKGPLPGLVFYHGGAWILFNVGMYDGICAHIARKANIIVISVEYRLAPENPFPAGFNDCVKVAMYALTNGGEIGLDPTRVAVGGDSAGGNLAAAVTLKLRDDKVNPALKGHMCIYGSLQFCNTFLPTHQIREANGGKAVEIFSYFLGSYVNLTQAQMDIISTEKFITPKIKEKCDRLVDINLIPKKLFPSDYTAGDCLGKAGSDDVEHISSFLDDTRIAPLMAENLENFPSSLVVSVEWDTLRDEDIIYAERLKKAGNKVRFLFLDGSFHGILQVFDYEKHGFKAGTTLMNEILDFIDKELSQK